VTGPYFKAISTVVPKFVEQVNMLTANVEEYKPLIDEYEQELNEGNKRF